LQITNPQIQNLPEFRSHKLELGNAQWTKLVSPAPGEGDKVEIGCRSDEPVPQSISEVRQALAQTDFLPLDPFVASVGASVAADQVEIPKGEKAEGIVIPGFYQKEIEVMTGFQNGPGAPLLVILPGIHSNGESSHNNRFKKMALERGMNYVMLPNSLSESMMEDLPRNHPGNPRVDALCTHKVLELLKERYPDHFNQVSVAGYSYGALHGANLVRLDEELDPANRLINGSLVALSPPQNLESSMKQLDSLRKDYEKDSGSITDVGLRYKHDVKKYGYEGFYQSDLSEHGPGTNITEIKIADRYGSRDGLQYVVEEVDTQFAPHILPKNTEHYKEAGIWERHQMRKEHEQIVENITYDQFSDQWMSQDDWLKDQGLTPSAMAELYSFPNAMEAIHQTPVMVLASADDYILAAKDVQTLRSLEKTSGELEVVKVYETGGHVALDWNPEIANAMVDFACAGGKLHA
jgi:pimeloyl-ACP methyl ester carboxylesterase